MSGVNHCVPLWLRAKSGGVQLMAWRSSQLRISIQMPGLFVSPYPQIKAEISASVSAGWSDGQLTEWLARLLINH
jgi:hypothetical protein